MTHPANDNGFPTPARMAALMLWREAHLWIHHKDQRAAARLAPDGLDVDEAALTAGCLLPQPTHHELNGVDSDGVALDPAHPFHGYVSWPDYVAYLAAEGRG